MSDTTNESSEPEWPENCSLCGTELQTGFVELEPTSDQGTDAGPPGPPVAQDFCPNPDCPGKAADLASAGEPVDEGVRARPADAATGPGSMGGDNGGG